MCMIRHSWLQLSVALVLGSVLLGTPVLADAPAGMMIDHRENAQTYMENKQWDYASYEWRTLLAQNPKNIEATLGLATALFKSGFTQDGYQVLEDAQKNIGDPQIDMALATAYQEANNPSAAASVYQNLLTRDPYNDDAYQGLRNMARILPDGDQRSQIKKQMTDIADQALKLGTEARKNKQYDIATKYYKIAALFDYKVKIVNDYALLLMLTGQSGKAAHFLNTLENANIKHWLLYANGAMANLSTGNVSAALQQMPKAIELAPNAEVKARLYNNLGYIYETGRQWTKARFAYERATELNPGLLKAWINLAYILQKKGDYKLAMATYQKILVRNAQNADVWNSMGYCYELLEKPKDALAAYQKAIELNPKLKEAYFNLGALYKNMDKPEKADMVLKQMVAVDFNEIEGGNSGPAAPDVLTKLLKYVDIFFSDQVV